MSDIIPLQVSSKTTNPFRPLPEQTFLPEAYRLPEGVSKGPISSITPQVVFIEVTNRCNLLCETCPRTFFERELLKTLTYQEFVQIADQFPNMRPQLNGSAPFALLGLSCPTNLFPFHI